MRPSQLLAVHPRGARTAATRTSIAAIAVGLVLCPAALAAAPAPCGGVVQISDDTGDGHHANTDVQSAWFSEQAGPLQAVIKVTSGDWRPMHVDSATASWAMLFDVAGQQHFVRVVASKTGTISYDYGTWTLGGGFVSAGATTGELTTGPGATVTIDVPAATGAAAGTVLARPFVLTYESDPAARGPVDRAPGGVTAQEAAFGADYVVGSCRPSGTAGSGAGGDAPTGGGEVAPATTTTVVLDAPRRIVGARRVRAGGRVIPARGGVPVEITTKARGSARPAIVRSVTTLADGSFSVFVPVSESSTMTAVAEQINSQTRTVVVQSTVRMTLRRLANGRTVASGRVTPSLPGRVLLLRTNAAVPSAGAAARRGLFRFAARRLARGRYQAVFIPSGDRAERSTSSSGAVR
jgi:hypothetical protein